MVQATHPEEWLHLDLLSVLLACPEALLWALLEELGRRAGVHSGAPPQHCLPSTIPM